VEPSVIVFAPHDSPPPQEPAVVEQPEAGVHTALQQPPAVQLLVAGVQEQPSQSPSPSQYSVQVAP
jgi:hypothetical protein